MGDQDFHRNPCIGVGRPRPAGRARIIMTKSDERCPPYAVEEHASLISHIEPYSKRGCSRWVIRKDFMILFFSWKSTPCFLMEGRRGLQ